MMRDCATVESDVMWARLRNEVAEMARQEPVLSGHLKAMVLDRASFDTALVHLIASKLVHSSVREEDLQAVGILACKSSAAIVLSARRDLGAAIERDPACEGLAHPFLNHKGFHALQTYRIAHWLWLQGRRSLASFLQARASEVFGVDIHPAAQIGAGVFIDHATGVVIGETSVVADDVSMFQDVTLGGTGKESGDRHPKVERGVLLCAGAKILGNVRIRIGAKVGAGSVVLSDVAPYTTVVGVPARPTGASVERIRDWQEMKMPAPADELDKFRNLQEQSS